MTDEREKREPDQRTDDEWQTALTAEQYRVQIRQFAGKCVVQVLNKEGAQANTDTTKRIVALLYEQLR